MSFYLEQKSHKEITKNILMEFPVSIYFDLLGMKNKKKPVIVIVYVLSLLVLVGGFTRHEVVNNAVMT